MYVLFDQLNFYEHVSFFLFFVFSFQIKPFFAAKANNHIKLIICHSTTFVGILAYIIICIKLFIYSHMFDILLLFTTINTVVIIASSPSTTNFKKKSSVGSTHFHVPAIVFFPKSHKLCLQNFFCGLWQYLPGQSHDFSLCKLG